MDKMYQSPWLKIVYLTYQDVVTASGDEDKDGYEDDFIV